MNSKENNRIKINSTLVKLFAIISAIGFAVLYFFGYLFLRLYFRSIGGLIPINDLPSTEIAILGIPPLIFFFFFFTIILNIHLYLSKLKWKGKKLFSKKVSLNNLSFLLNNIFYSLICLFVLLALVTNYFFTRDLPYNIFIVQKTYLPIVEMIYNSPLINNTQPRDLRLEKKSEGYPFYEATKRNKYQGIEYSLDELFGDETEFVNSEIVFTDQLGNKRFINTFRLYFESSDNYYLKPPTSFCAAHDKGETPFTFGERMVYPLDRDICEIIVMPKDHVESIKYINNKNPNFYPRLNEPIPMNYYEYGEKALTRIEMFRRKRSLTDKIIEWSNTFKLFTTKEDGISPNERVMDFLSSVALDFQYFILEAQESSLKKIEHLPLETQKDILEEIILREET